MDLIQHNVSYVLLLLFGAFAVAVHAYSMYGTALSLSADQQLSPILENVSLACGHFALPPFAVYCTRSFASKTDPLLRLDQPSKL